MNPHEETNRWKKAVAIADTIESLVRATIVEFSGSKNHWDIMLKHVEGATDEQWAQFALIAGKRPPSKATRVVIADILRWRAELARRNAS